MSEKGFVASALLYGILSLFLVLILGTLSVISNRKLASDRLKESALIDVEDLKTDENCFEFDIDETENTCTITGYDSNCGNLVYIDEKKINKCHLTGIQYNSFSGISDGYVYIKSYIEIDEKAFSGNENVTFITVGFKTSNDGKNGTIWGATNSYLKAY